MGSSAIVFPGVPAIPDLPEHRGTAASECDAMVDPHP
jgi:hypothetical protein